MRGGGARSVEHKARQYRGHWMHPTEPNGSGIRWWALVNGQYPRAVTLNGLMQLIKEARTDA